MGCVRGIALIGFVLSVGCVNFLPASDRAAAGQDGALVDSGMADAAGQDVRALDALVPSDTDGSRDSDVSIGLDVVAPVDGLGAPDAVAPPDALSGIDVPVSADAGGLVLIHAGFATASASTGTSGSMRLTSVGFVGGDRQCVGTLCLSGAISP